MTYHHNITPHPSLKNTKIWMDRIILSLLLLSTIVAAFYNSAEFNLFFTMPALALIIVLAVLVNRRHKISFVDIKDGTLSYLNTDNGKMVSVPVHDITHISTRFCQLNVHTAEGIHTLNLDMVRNEKTRWEIKEMIREIARQGQAVA